MFKLILLPKYLIKITNQRLKIVIKYNTKYIYIIHLIVNGLIFFIKICHTIQYF